MVRSLVTWPRRRTPAACRSASQPWRPRSRPWPGWGSNPALTNTGASHDLDETWCRTGTGRIRPALRPRAGRLRWSAGRSGGRHGARSLDRYRAGRLPGDDARLRAEDRCAGMADGSRSGWPGTDWIEDIVLHQSGPSVYDRWAAGALPWTSAPIVRAWQTFGQVAAAAGAVHGGLEAELVTSYGVAGRPMFSYPPGCYLEHEGSFIAGFT